MARHANTYRAARRNALRTGKNKGIGAFAGQRMLRVATPNRKGKVTRPRTAAR
jgi:hypothetical protein